MNGFPAPTGTTLYNGNCIVTGPGTVAVVLLSQGGRLVLDASTSVVVSVRGHRSSVWLEKGSLGAVSVAKVPVVVEARGVAISATSGKGTFTVVDERDALSVSALHGNATVKGANKTVDVRAGTTLKASLTSALSGKKKSHLKAELVVSGVGAATALAVATRELSGTHSHNCISPAQLNCL